MRNYSFSGFLSDDEKKRTAREIICFMYLLNEDHVLAHLPGAKPDIDSWITSIGCGEPADTDAPVTGNE